MALCVAFRRINFFIFYNGSVWLVKKEKRRKGGFTG